MPWQRWSQPALCPALNLQEGAEHSHSSNVTSVGIEAEGELDFKKVQAWLGTLLRVRYMGLRAGATPAWHVRVQHAKKFSGCAALHTQYTCCDKHVLWPTTQSFLLARVLRTTVQEKGTDIFRSKGILCLKGSSDK